MPISTVRQTRLYRQIADQLQRLIREGEFPPGTCLPPERELSQLLGVSRASVREALIALEVVGDVAVRVGHGVVVLDNQRSSSKSVLRDATTSEPWQIDPEFAGEIELNLDEEIPPFSLLQARRHIEPETAALAAVNATPKDMEALHAALERNIEDNRLIDQGEKIENYHFVGDRLLHIRIAEASQNTAYALLIKHLLSHKYGAMFRRLQEYHMENHMWNHSQNHHERIVSAIVAGNESEARNVMSEHLDHVLNVFFPR